MIINNFEFIKKITEAHGPSGSEEDVREIIKEELKSFVDEFSFDNLGSIICRLNKDAKGPKVAILAHMDEVGFLVQDITEKGCLKVYKNGGINPFVALNKEVIIKTRKNNYIKGIISTEKDLKDLKIEDLFIDIGMRTKDDIKKLGIRIGDSVSFSRKTEYLGEDNIISKSWDDRVGCILGIDILKRLKNADLNCDLYFVGSVQEEIGTRGGKTSMDLLNPDIVLVIDVATAKEKTRKYGEGPCIVIADKLALGNKTLINYCADIGDEFNINYQFDFLGGGGTDNGPTTLTKSGIAGVSIILPVKNCHTPNTILNIGDYENTNKLLEKIIINIENNLLLDIYSYKL